MFVNKNKYYFIGKIWNGKDEPSFDDRLTEYHGLDLYIIKKKWKLVCKSKKKNEVLVCGYITAIWSGNKWNRILRDNGFYNYNKIIISKACGKFI